jgi:hypothetical protein
MWAEAARAVAGFAGGAVVTGLDTDGYPVSVRVRAPRYDLRTGELPVIWPEPFTSTLTPGPAMVLCHHHNRKLLNIRIAQIKGRLEQRGDDWVFVTTAFTSPLGVISGLRFLARTNRAAGARYLQKCGLPPPVVNRDSITELRRRARKAGR